MHNSGLHAAAAPRGFLDQCHLTGVGGGEGLDDTGYGGAFMVPESTESFLAAVLVTERKEFGRVLLQVRVRFST